METCSPGSLLSAAVTCERRLPTLQKTDEVMGEPAVGSRPGVYSVWRNINRILSE